MNNPSNIGNGGTPSPAGNRPFLVQKATAKTTGGVAKASDIRQSLGTPSLGNPDAPQNVAASLRQSREAAKANTPRPQATKGPAVGRPGAGSAKKPLTDFGKAVENTKLRAQFGCDEFQADAHLIEHNFVRVESWVKGAVPTQARKNLIVLQPQAQQLTLAQITQMNITKLQQQKSQPAKMFTMPTPGQPQTASAPHQPAAQSQAQAGAKKTLFATVNRPSTGGAKPANGNSSSAPTGGPVRRINSDQKDDSVAA